jgi:hypothetical protein
MPMRETPAWAAGLGEQGRHDDGQQTFGEHGDNSLQGGGCKSGKHYARTVTRGLFVMVVRWGMVVSD